jgi:hypothetical protein
MQHGAPGRRFTTLGRLDHERNGVPMTAHDAPKEIDDPEDHCRTAIMMIVPIKDTVAPSMPTGLQRMTVYATSFDDECLKRTPMHQRCAKRYELHATSQTNDERNDHQCENEIDNAERPSQDNEIRGVLGSRTRLRAGRSVIVQ